MNLSDNLLHLVNNAQSIQSPDGAMPPGHNGPYVHQETPVRNTAHWLISFASAWKWTGEESYRLSAVQAAEYLISECGKVPQGNPPQRQHPGRDDVNGVIGAAWLLEALAVAWRKLEMEEACILALELALRHRQDASSGLWHRLTPTGNILSLDQTFNHQLWFAASVANFRERSPTVERAIQLFLQRLPSYVTLTAAGFIPHRIELSLLDRILREGSSAYLVYAKGKALQTGRPAPDLRARRVGYHPFNLLGFSRLHLSTSGHAFWQSREWQALIDRSKCFTPDEPGLRDNPYAYPYNPTGFEMAVATHQQNWGKNRVSEWLHHQWDQATAGGTVIYGDRAADPVTCRARMYEALAYLPPSEWPA